MSDGFGIPTTIKRVAMTNLVPAINGTEGFTAGGGSGTRTMEASTVHTKYATQSLKMTVGSDCAEVCANSTGTYPLDTSHVYYFRIEGYQEVKGGTMEMYFPIAEPRPFNLPAKEAGQWNIYSAVSDRSAFSSGNQRFRIDFNNGNPFTNAEVWYDGVMIIDLTAACGAGNEPSQEWCDANIPYFNGSYTLDIPVSAPILALVAGLDIPDGVVKQITDAAGNVLWSALRLVSGTLYLRPSADISLGHGYWPNTLTAGYLAINEAESDDYTTYLSTNMGDNFESVFSMAFAENAKPVSISTMKLVAVDSFSDSTGLEHVQTYVVTLEDGTQYSATKTHSGSTSGFVVTEFDLSSIVNAINNHIGETGSFPAITLTVNSVAPKNTIKSSSDHKLTQVYIELTGDYYA